MPDVSTGDSLVSGSSGSAGFSPDFRGFPKGILMPKIGSLTQLHQIDREARLLERAIALLHWDMDINLPPKAVEERSDQLALLEGLSHEMLTGKINGRLLDDLGSTPENPGGDEGLSPAERDFLKVFRRNYDRLTKLPARFVKDAARAEGLSQPAWVKARKNNDFSIFLPHLKKMVEIARKKSSYWGYENTYDGLISIYEPDMTQEDISRLFTPLKDSLVKLIKQIQKAPQPNPDFLKLVYDVKKQETFNREVMNHIGFDEERGRLDVSVHPFTTSLGTDDVRITTRYVPDNMISSVFSTIHETGHALYELGFPREIQGTCLADGASMGIHESQSRLWENVIGRSREFWTPLYGRLQHLFQKQLDPVRIDDFIKAVNRVEPSCIRVDADEVSYSLHIILRFELEKQLFSGVLTPEDLPGAWRSMMKEYLGVDINTDTQGVLQDVHWSMGSFGYFPSYALGNLYGLQIWNRLKKDIPQVYTQIEAGSFREIQTWLRDTLYVWGKRLSPSDMLVKVTGKALSPAPFVQYIKDKYTDLYGLG